MHVSSCRTPVRVAVVGSGLAGLTSAHILTSVQTSPNEPDGLWPPAFQATLFEKSETTGVDAGSIDLKCPCSNCTGNSDWTLKHLTFGPAESGRSDAWILPQHLPVVSEAVCLIECVIRGCWGRVHLFDTKQGNTTDFRHLHGQNPGKRSVLSDTFISHFLTWKPVVRTLAASLLTTSTSYGYLRLLQRPAHSQLWPRPRRTVIPNDINTMLPDTT